MQTAGRIFAAKDTWAPEYRELGDIFQGVKAVDWSPPAPKVGPRKVVVAGWCGEVEDLTASLTMFAPVGTDITMVCECAPEVSFLCSSARTFCMTQTPNAPDAMTALWAATA